MLICRVFALWPLSFIGFVALWRLSLIGVLGQSQFRFVSVTAEDHVQQKTVIVCCLFCVKSKMCINILKNILSIVSPLPSPQFPPFDLNMKIPYRSNCGTNPPKNQFAFGYLPSPTLSEFLETIFHTLWLLKHRLSLKGTVPRKKLWLLSMIQLIWQILLRPGYQFGSRHWVSKYK